MTTDKNTGATLLFALHFPDIDPTAVDPDALADDIVQVLNDDQIDGFAEAEVSALPAPSWLDAKTLARLSAAADVAAAATEYREALLAVDAGQGTKLSDTEWDALEGRVRAADKRLKNALDTLT